MKKHSNPDSAWIIVHGHVYDCTRFLKDHPGGEHPHQRGTDCTEEFEAIHSDKAKKMLEDYRIGELITTGYNSDSSPNNSLHGNSEITPHLAPIKEIITIPTRSVALNPREKIPCKLVSKISISHDVRIFRFALPSEDQLLGLPVGHIFLCAAIDGKLCMRAYTPTSGVDEIGFFELVVKVYFKGAPQVSQRWTHVTAFGLVAYWSVLDVKGPLGHIEYNGRGNFLVHGKQRFAKRLAMLAGGTGITPIYQVAQAILKDPEDRTEMHSLMSGRRSMVIGSRCGMWWRVRRMVWEYSVGFITESIMRAHVPEAGEDTLALTCGPPPMIQFAVQPNLEKMGYDVKNDLLVF
ncbi:Riboflavin synthase-like beta-barrel [Sesbania bispinosa]|nr:Riboflavin synthase-like beta-barrel [Sesbania bispinosa]